MTTPLTQLEAAIELVRKAHPTVGNVTTVEAAMLACMDLIDQHGETLRAELADKERMDWLEKAGFTTRNPSNSAADAGVHSWRFAPGEWRWTAHYIGSNFTTAREAIDRAIAASKDGSNG